MLRKVRRGKSGRPEGKESGVQPGIVGLRGALMAAWEADLRAVRQDTFDMGRGREAHVFMQRFYALISELRSPIQRAWGPGGHVHVVDSPDVGGPGPRVSQSRVRLRNHGYLVAVELFSYADGSYRANPSAGLDRDIRVVDVDPLAWVDGLYRTAVDFLQAALNLDLLLGGSGWLFEHVAANHFVASGRWASLGEVYRWTTREFAVLEALLRQAGTAIPKQRLLDDVWDFAFDGDANIVEVYIGYLRRKIDRPFGCHAIETVRGIGYRIRSDGG